MLKTQSRSARQCHFTASLSHGAALQLAFPHLVTGPSSPSQVLPAVIPHMCSDGVFEAAVPSAARLSVIQVKGLH